MSPSAQGTASAGTSVQTVTISPVYFELKRGASVKFSASLANFADTSVTWSILEGSSGGAITEAGLYTAPSVDGVYHVIAKAKVDPTNGATAIVSVGASAFTLTGSLSVGRFSHTAIRTPSGQVLVVGGETALADGNRSYVDQTEQYNPTAGAFQAIGKFGRNCSSVSLLPSGDILFAGGSNEQGSSSNYPPVPTSSAELLKNGTGVLQPTGSMSVARCGHSATVLQDGRVLIIGGQSQPDSSGSVSAEIYDPVSGTFAPAGNLVGASAGSIGTLLLNGKVLFVGFGSAAVYDPATNSFTATVGSPAKRFAFTATLLPDGRVLIAGGETDYDILYGGPAELYDPATGLFTPTGNLTITRWGHTATLLSDGSVLLAGGVPDANNSPTNTTEIYNPTTGLFSLGPTMMRGRVLHTATLLADGSVLLVGGWRTNTSSGDTSAEIYQ